MHCAMRAFPLLPCTEIPTGRWPAVHSQKRERNGRAILQAVDELPPFGHRPQEEKRLSKSTNSIETDRRIRPRHKKWTIIYIVLNSRDVCCIICQRIFCFFCKPPFHLFEENQVDFWSRHSAPKNALLFH